MTVVLRYSTPKILWWLKPPSFPVSLLVNDGPKSHGLSIVIENQNLAHSWKFHSNCNTISTMVKPTPKDMLHCDPTLQALGKTILWLAAQPWHTGKAARRVCPRNMLTASFQRPKLEPSKVPTHSGTGAVASWAASYNFLPIFLLRCLLSRQTVCSWKWPLIVDLLWTIAGFP